MSIRYQCEQCGSKLTIRDEKAGTTGKCPKCKSEFTVPEPVSAESETRKVVDAVDATVARPKAAAAKKPSAAGRQSRRQQDDDFDPMAVLMGDEPGTAPKSRSKPSSPPLSDDELPADLDLDLELGEDDDQPVVKKPKKRKRVQFDSDDEFDAALPNPSPGSGSASASANAMLAGGASAGAKDLLTRTMEESRARASRLDDDEPGDRGPTIRDYIREYGPRAGLIVVAFVAVTYGLYRFAGSMYGSGMPLPELARVYGVVRLDGQPLEGATVRFEPTDRSLTIGDRGKHKIRASTAKTDAEGYYDLYYIEDVRGAALTEHRVMIEKFDADGRLVTPPEYYDASMETRTVESGSNEFNFELETNAPAPRPRENG